MLCLILMLALTGSEPNLVGVWQLENNPNAAVRNETLSFYANGKLFIDGDIAQRGSYSLKDGKLTTVFMLGGEKQSLARTYKLNGDRLSLDGDRGTDRYRKLAQALPPWKEGGWEHHKIGFFELDIPVDWQIHKEKPDASGSQRLVLQDPERANALTLLHIPGRGKDVNLSNALKGVMRPLLEGLQIVDAVINESRNTFYNRVGTRLETVKRVGDKSLGVHTFGQKLENDQFLVALITYEDGTQAELEKLMSSLKTPQDPDLKKAQAELAKELAAAKKAKPADTHQHGDHKH